MQVPLHRIVPVSHAHRRGIVLFLLLFAATLLELAAEWLRVEGGPTLSRRQMVVAGFGGFLARGGGVLDQYALEAAGADENEAKVRVSSLAGLEHGVLAIGGCGCAIAVLAAGLSQPPLDFTIPWAVIPVPGFLIAFRAAER